MLRGMYLLFIKRKSDRKKNPKRSDNPLLGFSLGLYICRAATIGHIDFRFLVVPDSVKMGSRRKLREQFFSRVRHRHEKPKIVNVSRS